MNTTLTLYLLVVISKATPALTFCAIIAAIIYAALALSMLNYCHDLDDNDEEGWKLVKKFVRNAIMAIFFAVAISAVVPSRNEMAAIYILPKIIENKEITQIPENAAKLLNKYLEEKWGEEYMIGNDKNDNDNEL